MQEVRKEANKRVIDNDQTDRESTKKEKPPGRQGKGREPDEGGEAMNDKKRNTGAGKQAQNTGVRNSSKTKSEQQRNPKTKTKKRERLPQRRKRQTSEYPSTESQKTDIGDPTLSGAQKTPPEHTNRIEQTKANSKQRGNPVKRCQ